MVECCSAVVDSARTGLSEETARANDLSCGGGCCVVVSVSEHSDDSPVLTRVNERRDIVRSNTAQSSVVWDPATTSWMRSH